MDSSFKVILDWSQVAQVLECSRFRTCFWKAFYKHLLSDNQISESQVCFPTEHENCGVLKIVRPNRFIKKFFCWLLVTSINQLYGLFINRGNTDFLICFQAFLHRILSKILTSHLLLRFRLSGCTLWSSYNFLFRISF